MTDQSKILTADGKEVGVGDRVFNHYDMKWGTIVEIDDHAQPDTMKGQSSATPMEEWDNYWFTVKQEDGTRCSLDGSRITTYDVRRK